MGLCLVALVVLVGLFLEASFTGDVAVVLGGIF